MCVLNYISTIIFTNGINFIWLNNTASLFPNMQFIPKRINLVTHLQILKKIVYQHFTRNNPIIKRI